MLQIQVTVLILYNVISSLTLAGRPASRGQVLINLKSGTIGIMQNDNKTLGPCNVRAGDFYP